MFMSDSLMMLKQLVLTVRLPLSPGRKEIILMECRDYRFKLCNFLNQLEAKKITKLCNAACTNEKLFWRLLKGQRSTSQMGAFLIDGKIITDKKQILDKWAA